MNPLAWSFRLQMLLGSSICVTLVGFAFYTQIAWGLEPCELCVQQRVVYLILAGIFLITALITHRAHNLRRGLVILPVITALTGAFIAGKQIWLKLFPPEMPVCKVSFDTFPVEPSLWQQLFTPTIECGLGGWEFLGLSMPAWSLVWFVLLGMWTLWAGYRSN